MGQLKGGSASCQQPSGLSAYGRFDFAYSAALSRWLSPAGGSAGTSATVPAVPRVAVHRFYNAAIASHFYTASAAERDYVLATLPTFAYEGVAFYAYDRQVAGSSPVFRLYSRLDHRHFYTVSADERSSVLATFPQFTDEGTAWHAQWVAGGTAAPVYRFYNSTTAGHFYTFSELEKASVLQNIPTYLFERVAYYAWPTQ